MTWTQNVPVTNEWENIDYTLYVLPDYWIAGYTDDGGSVWSNQIPQTNTWSVIG